MARDWNESELKIVKKLELIVGRSLEDIKNYETPDRTPSLEVFRTECINRWVLERYLLIDYLLGQHIKIVTIKFSKKVKKGFNINGLPVVYSIFIDSILEELTLLSKFQIFDNIIKLSNKSKIRDFVFRINTIRNRIAHSYFPQYSPKYKITYNDKSIYSEDGFSAFWNDGLDVTKEIGSLSDKRLDRNRKIPKSQKTPLT